MPVVKPKDGNPVFINSLQGFSVQVPAEGREVPESLVAECLEAGLELVEVSEDPKPKRVPKPKSVVVDPSPVEESTP